ncbi:MAG: amidophosphoribosyltransferase, partial [Proteobacteria bacterium]|nr:amidophosphoribosyltransferase [Pseudomonadota bacterium]
MKRRADLPEEDGHSQDSLQEECAVFGIYGNSEAHLLTALGLHALQHRGQEATGMVSFDGTKFNAFKGIGHVGENFSAGSKTLNDLKGHVAIGHNRYSTTGLNEVRNIQPFLTEMGFGNFAIAHNGNLINAERLRTSLVETGSLFQSTTDTEVIIHLVARSHQTDPVDRLTEALQQVAGAYALVSVVDDKLIGVRDPNGIRPLILGQLGDIYPVFVLEGSGQREAVSSMPGVERLSIDLLVELAKEAHIAADLVIPVPDSGVPAALGYAQQSGIPFELGIIRNHYVGRTFIQPTEAGRTSGVMMKHNANSEVISGKDIILVDDSIVRGTTSRKIVTMMREAGARSVHMRIASPPTTNPCFYGVDTPEKDKLMAAKLSVTEMCREIGADSLAFISIDGLYRAMGEAARNKDMPQFCDACFTGEYPVIE